MARPKGSKNKVGESAKDNILAVFTRLGGTAAMAAWAQDNQTEFYRIYARLIPTEVGGQIDHTVTVDVGDESTLAERLARNLSLRAPVPETTIQ